MAVECYGVSCLTGLVAGIGLHALVGNEPSLPSRRRCGVDGLKSTTQESLYADGYSRWRASTGPNRESCTKSFGRSVSALVAGDKASATSTKPEERSEAPVDASVGLRDSSGRRPRLLRRESAIYTQVEQRVTEEKLVIVMVGLPARGKSYISKALVRYLNFLGCRTKLFNAGSLRRDEGKAGIAADFFDPNNTEAKGQREAMAMQCLEELLGYLKQIGNSVGILDATNTTIERRTKVRERVAKIKGVSVMFLESLCLDEAVLAENYRLKLGNDDYVGMDAQKAAADFEQRVARYEEVYQPIEDVEDGHEMSYIKLIDAGKKLTKNNCLTSARRTLPGHVFNLLHSIHLGGRSIFLSLVGESENNVSGILGGDSPLTLVGSRRGPALQKFLNDREGMESSTPGEGSTEPIFIMCGTLQRHLHTVARLNRSSVWKRNRHILKLQRLNDLCVGGMDGMSLEEIKNMHPEELKSMEANAIAYRYPGEGGESYQDLILRLHETILRLEQLRGSCMILCDPTVLRVLLAYFRGTPLEGIPTLEVPSGIVQLTRTHSGFQEKHIDLNTDSDSA